VRRSRDPPPQNRRGCGSEILPYRPAFSGITSIHRRNRAVNMPATALRFLSLSLSFKAIVNKSVYGCQE
jgi:hypothetical protein